MKKNNEIQEWLQLYDTPAIPINKMNELISAGQKYMDSAEFNKNSFQTTRELKVCTTKKPGNPRHHQAFPAVYELFALCVNPAFALKGRKNISGNSA